jgi:hypothetical protein
MNLLDGLNGFLRICLAVSLSIFEQDSEDLMDWQDGFTGFYRSYCFN